MWSFCTAKAPYIILAKNDGVFSIVQYIWKCNNSFTNNVVSFEQPDPAVCKMTD